MSSAVSSSRSPTMRRASTWTSNARRPASATVRSAGRCSTRWPMTAPAGVPASVWTSSTTNSAGPGWADRAATASSTECHEPGESWPAPVIGAHACSMRASAAAVAASSGAARYHATGAAARAANWASAVVLPMPAGPVTRTMRWSRARSRRRSIRARGTPLASGTWVRAGTEIGVPVSELTSSAPSIPPPECLTPAWSPLRPAPERVGVRTLGGQVRGRPLTRG